MKDNQISIFDKSRLPKRQTTVDINSPDFDESLYTQEELWKFQLSDIRGTKIRDMIIDAILVGVSLVMPLTKWSDGLKCHTPMIMWLLVQSGIYSLSLIRHIIVLIAIHNTNKSPRDVKMRIEIFYICFVLNFEVGWLIYGNTFHYTPQAMQCMQINDNTHQLWILMMLIIGFGYFVMFMYAMVLIIAAVAGCVMYCCYRERLREDIQDLMMDNPIADRIPYIDVVKGLQKKRFGKVKKEHRTMESCAICLGEYKEDEEVAELGCDERHYFHLACIDDWLKRKLECPLCKKAVET